MNLNGANLFLSSIFCGSYKVDKESVSTGMTLIIHPAVSCWPANGLFSGEHCSEPKALVYLEDRVTVIDSLLLSLPVF